jgi:Ran GTPase-activating protein (RanGAP) involved in mRNA processing and transport
LDEACIQELTSTLNMSSVTTLCIDENPQGNGLEHLYALFIDEDSPVKNLILRGNHISDKGAASIAAALKYNRTLSCLNLWGNRVGKDGADSLAEVRSATK